MEIEIDSTIIADIKSMAAGVKEQLQALIELVTRCPEILKNFTVEQANWLKEQAVLQELGRRLGLYKPASNFSSNSTRARSRKRRRAAATANLMGTPTPVTPLAKQNTQAVLQTPDLSSLPPPPPPLSSAIASLHNDIQAIMDGLVETPSGNNNNNNNSDAFNFSVGGGPQPQQPMPLALPLPLPPPPMPLASATAAVDVNSVNKPNLFSRAKNGGAGSMVPMPLSMPPPPLPSAASGSADATSPVLGTVPFSGADMLAVRHQLRRVPTSPHGTPMRSAQQDDMDSNGPRDTQSIIALALRKKFASLRESAIRAPRQSTGRDSWGGGDDDEMGWSPNRAHPAYFQQPPPDQQSSVMVLSEPLVDAAGPAATPSAASKARARRRTNKKNNGPAVKKPSQQTVDDDDDQEEYNQEDGVSVEDRVASASPKRKSARHGLGRFSISANTPSPPRQRSPFAEALFSNHQSPIGVVPSPQKHLFRRSTRATDNNVENRQ